MQDNIDVSLQNCVKLESIERQAEELQLQANVFKKNSNALKNKMRCKDLKCKIMCGIAILAVIGAIVGIIVWQTKKADPAPTKAPSGRRLDGW